MTVHIKVCGLRSPATVAAAIEAGADSAGLNFVPGARRWIEVSMAKDLASRLEPVTPIGVFRNQPADEVMSLAEQAGLTRIQLHGDERTEDVRRLAKRFEVVRAVAFDRLDEVLPPIADVLHAVIVDARTPGEGHRWSLDRLPELSEGRHLGVPLWVAGGLDPDNVQDVIRSVRPAGVDVASGIERQGRECPERLMAFVRAARAGFPQAMTSAGTFLAQGRGVAQDRREARNRRGTGRGW